MPTTESLIEQMRRSQNNVAFSDLERVVFSLGYVLDRQRGSHKVYRADGRPRIVLAPHGGQVKAYQVRQVLAIIDGNKAGG